MTWFHDFTGFPFLSHRIWPSPTENGIEIKPLKEMSFRASIIFQCKIAISISSIGYPNSNMKDSLTENITRECCFEPVYIWYRSPRRCSGKESVCQGHGLNPWIRKIPHSRKWQPTPVFLYFCLENSMDRGAWQATIHGVAKSQTRLSTA